MGETPSIPAATIVSPVAADASKEGFDAFAAFSGDAPISYRIVDRLVATSPVLDMTLGESAEAVPYLNRNAVTSQRALDIVTCGGYLSQSSFSIFQRSIRPLIRSKFDFNEPPRGLWAARCVDDTAIVTEAENEAVLALDSGITETTPALPSSNARTEHRFVVMSTQDRQDRHSTIVLETRGTQLDELQRSDFMNAVATIHVASLFNYTRVLQVHPSGARLLNSNGKMTQELKVDGLFLYSSTGTGASLDQGLGDPERRLSILTCSICERYAIFVMNDGSLVALEADESKKELNPVDVPKSIMVRTKLRF